MCAQQNGTFPTILILISGLFIEIKLILKKSNYIALSNAKSLFYSLDTVNHFICLITVSVT